MSRPRTLHELLCELVRILRAIGKRVQHRREAGGLTRAELAIQTGLTVATIRAMESGRVVDLDAWAKLIAHPSMRTLPEQVKREVWPTFRTNGGR